MTLSSLNKSNNTSVSLPLDSAPIGSIQDFSGVSVPIGYLPCDGSAVSRTVYASLFAQTGTRYGSGDGITTFNLPNAYSYIRRSNGLTRGSTNTTVVIYGTADLSVGSDITYVNSAANGDSFTINTSGIYSITANMIISDANAVMVIKAGTLANGTSSTDACTRTQAYAGNTGITSSWTGYIAATKSVWVATNSTIYNDATYSNIYIARVA